MKKTQRKDSVRNIRKRIVSYLSICLVIMLGCGAFLTTRFMEAGLGHEAATYESSHNFKNFEMISSLGLTDENIEDIKKIEGVDDAEGIMIMTATISKGYSKRTATLLSETKRVSVPELMEGKMPTEKNEIALAEDFSEKSGIAVGDNVRIQIKTGDMDYPLFTHKFVVTGLIRHPDYIHRKLSNIIVLPITSFNKKVTDGCYTRVYLKSKDAPPDKYYSDEYLEEAQKLYERLDGLSGQFEVKRTNEFKAKALAEIDKEWKKAEAKLNESQAKIDSGRSELNSKLASGRKTLNDAQSKLNKKVKEYEKKLKDAEDKLNKAKKYCRDIDKRLPGIKKEFKERHQQYKNDIKSLEAQIAALEAYIKGLSDLPELTEEEKQKIREMFAEISETIDRICDAIESVQDFLKKKEVQDIIAWIKDVSEGKIDLSGVVKSITDFDTASIRSIIDQINELLDKLDNKQEFIKEAEKLIASLKDSIAHFKELDKQLDDFEKYIELYEKNKDSYLAKAEKALKDAKEKLRKARKKYQDQIDAGWNKYYKLKRKYESKLEEAIALLAENREKAEKKLEEAKKEVENVKCKWLTLDRKSNAGYLDIKSQLATLHRSGTLFGVLFLFITAMVCLSTLSIIIEEQKDLIGTTKAFGFRKREVLSKYLMFGVTASIVGSIMAFIVGSVLSEAVLQFYKGQGMYPLDNVHTIIKPGATVIISLAMIAICILSTVLACTDILKSPASMLMKGETLAGNKAANKKKNQKASKAGSLYSRLIIRNMKDDKARVIISVVIVASCCLLMGLGVTLKMSFSDTMYKQGNEINNFDLRADFASSVPEKDRKAIEKVITDSGAEYIEAMFENRIYRGSDGMGGINIVCAKSDEIEDYIGFTLDGRNVEPPEDGILLPAKMGERYSLSPGDKITIYDSDVEGHDINIEGFYNCYFGRMSIITPEAYKAYFGEAVKYNSRYIHLNGADSKTLRKAILAVNKDVSFDTPTSFRSSVEASLNLFNVITLVTTGIAILMSFMILTNLANIFLTRKKTELSVMRVNGFSIRQAKGYLARETIITTLIGLAVGVLLGSLFSSMAIRMIEPIDMQFDRSYQWQAWLIAAALEGVFALIIYTTTFRKVKKLNLRDIA